MEVILKEAQSTLGAKPEVINVKKGYRFKNGWITDEEVIAVEVTEKLSPEALDQLGREPIPESFMGVPIDIRTAPIIEQLDYIGLPIKNFLYVAKPGGYLEPPHLKLKPINETMTAIFHVSPDSGFPNLKSFIGRVENRLTGTMYEWDKNHISEAIVASIGKGAKKLKMVTQKAGTKDAVLDMQNELGDKFEHVWASVGTTGGALIPSAYHIKVAVRDGKEVWLSSGNWKKSNQADIDPAGEDSTLIGPLNDHNREWHVIVDNPSLATMFENYINWDFQEAQRVPYVEKPKTLADEIQVFIPLPSIEPIPQPADLKYFDPLVVKNRKLTIQPLLTPDRNEHGNRMFMDFVLKTLEGAKTAIYIENQSFALLENNEKAFGDFFSLLKRKQDEGVEIKIIFRDGREFGKKNIKGMQDLLERIKKMGIDTDQIKVQKGCHTKAIITDPEDPKNATVIFGSHNLTNGGALFNRDASLLIRDHEIVSYFTEIFNFDWNTMARRFVADQPSKIRLAAAGEQTPIGYKKVALTDLLQEYF